jgi:folate-binding protein YgfZ
VELADRTHELGMLHVCGPEAPAVLARVLGQPLPDIPLLHHVSGAIAESPCFVRRHDPLGLPGYDVWCESDRIAEVSGRLDAAGATPAGAEAYEILRVEAGTPEFGKDIDEERFVVEVGRTAQAICYTKGCFLGQEPIVMARDRGHVNRMLVGVSIEGGVLPPKGTPLFRDGAEVGQVTSSVLSPRLGQPLALAYVRRGSWESGTRLKIDSAADGRAATVINLPVA